MHRKFSLLAAALAVGTLAAVPAVADTTTPTSATTTATHHAAKGKHHGKTAKAKTGHVKSAKAKDTTKKAD